VRLRQGFGATVFAPLYDASEDWRQGDYAPASASDNVPWLLDVPPRLPGFGGKGIRTPDFQLAKLALYQLSYAPVLMIAKCGLSIGGCKEQSVGGVAAPSVGQRSYPGNLSANTSAFSIFGGCARSSGAFSIKALATFPDRCASHPASSRNASKMAKVVGPSLIPNQAVVAGSCCTKPCASRKNFATSFSLPGFASSLTNNAFVVMW